MEKFLRVFRDVEESAKSQRFCFILGSGCARSSGIPPGAALADRWLLEMHDDEHAAPLRFIKGTDADRFNVNRLNDADKARLATWAETAFTHVKGFTFPQRAQYYGRIFERRYDPTTDLGTQFLRTVMLDNKPSVGYHLLARVLCHTRHNIVITTNFDRLVEDAVAVTENLAIHAIGSAKLAEYLKAEVSRPVVAKVHGDIEQETYNATSQIEELQTDWHGPLRSLLTRYTPVVIGYGGNDPGFMRFLINEVPGVFTKRHLYWALHDMGKNEQCIFNFVEQPMCAEFAKLDCVRLIRTPGFTPLMLLLNEILGYEPLEKGIMDAAKKVAAELENAYRDAGDEVSAYRGTGAAGHFGNIAIPPTGVGAGPVPTRNWSEWIAFAYFEPNPAAQSAAIARALLEYPSHPALKAVDLSYRADVNPKAAPFVESIRALLADSLATYGAEAPETLSVKHSLARTLDACEGDGVLHEVEGLYREVIAGREKLLGAEHPDTLTSRNNLGTTLQAQGKNPEAEVEHRAVLAVRERVVGPEHPNTLVSRNNLANVLGVQGKTGEAEAEQRAILAISERVLGGEHPNTLTGLHNLAITLQVQEKSVEAIELAKRAEAGRKKVLGPEHPDAKGSERIRKLIETAIAASAKAQRKQEDGGPD